jgi:predicted DNA-binding antitoxin AbrB/MazE fold protein
MKAVKGVYEKGIVRLLEPVSLPDQQEVTVLVPSLEESTHPALRFAGMLQDLTPEEQARFEESLNQRLPFSRLVSL